MKLEQNGMQVARKSDWGLRESPVTLPIHPFFERTATVHWLSHDGCFQPGTTDLVKTAALLLG